jgi:DNA-binding transcriptional LysR family regulator
VAIVFRPAGRDNPSSWNKIDEFSERMDAPGDMRAFVRVVEQQSFSAAAASVGLTPSAVSRLVSKLEDRLGVRLLHRTTRRLTLTSEGEVYFARARSILADIDEVETEVRKSRGTPRGRLSINTSNAFGIHQLVPALPEFLQRYPEIEVELSFADPSSNGSSAQRRLILKDMAYLIRRQISRSMSALLPFHRAPGRFTRATAPIL